MPPLHLFTLVFLTLPFSFVSAADDIAHFASDHWQGFTNTDGSGLYWDIIREVYQKNHITVAFETTNYTRSVALTKARRAQAYVGSYLNEADFALYPEYHLDVDYISACGSVAHTDEISEQALAGASVAWIKDYAFNEVLNVTLDFQELPDRATGLKMVANRRIDYYLDADSDIRIFLQDKPELAAQLKCQVIHKEKIYLAFADSPFARELMELWDSTMPSLIQSGYLKMKYEQYALKPFPY
jgi:polar amino acid transport system substrate-binding protein